MNRINKENVERREVSLKYVVGYKSKIGGKTGGCKLEKICAWLCAFSLIIFVFSNCQNV